MIFSCEFCGASQRIESAVYSCKKCGAPLKPPEILSPVEKMFSKASSLFSSSPEYCVHIIDISKWQGNINANVYRDSDSKYLIFKASQGILTDNKFEQNLKMCLSNEFPFGIYSFIDTRVNVNNAAKHFSKQANSIVGTKIDEFRKNVGFCNVTFWIDVELTYGANPDVLRSYIREFIRIFKEETGFNVGVYTRASFWNVYVSSMVEIHNHPLWTAHHNIYISEPLIPDDWKDFGKKENLWQYSADGNLEGHDYGAESWSIDKNKFMGTCDEFNQYYIGKDIEIPPVESEGCKFEYEAIYNVNYRKQPLVSSSTYVGTFAKGTIVEMSDCETIVNDNNVWFEFEMNDQVFYTAFVYNGKRFWNRKKE